MNPKITCLLAVSGWIVVAATSQAQTYCVAGVYNSWNASANPMTAGPHAGEYTYTITGGTPGAYDQAKVTDGTWNNSWPNNNLEFLYDSTGSATIHFWPGNFTDGWLPVANRVGYDDPNNDAGWGLAGDFDGWDGTQALLTAIGNGVYSNNIVVTTAGSFGFKFQSPAGNWSDINFANPDFGNGNNNGSYATTQPNQTLPVVLDLPDGRYYVGAPALPPTNTVTFQLDLSEQVAFGNFTNTDLIPSDPNFGLPANSVAVGGFNGDWGTDNQLTNYTILHPEVNNPGLKTNLYIGTFSTQGYTPISFQWKYRVNSLDGGYEQPVSTSGGNRSTTLTKQNTALPVTSYDDEGLGDLVVSNSILVTFSIYCTNGTLDDTGYAFQKGVDNIFISGAWLGWPTWGYNNLPASQQMVEVGSSDVYTNSFAIPRGKSIYMTYKYSLNGVDDENGTGTNHIREIRSCGPTYSFPQDVWSWTVLQPGNGNTYPNPGIASTNIVEPDFGYLAIGALSGGNLPITWLGRPAVMLQSSSSLTGGSWNTLNATDGTQSTNWPNDGGTQFFRLMKE
jgi:hypothetical protein